MVAAAQSWAQEGGIGKKVNPLDQAVEALPLRFLDVNGTGPFDEHLWYLSQGRMHELAVSQVA